MKASVSFWLITFLMLAYISRQPHSGADAKRVRPRSCRSCRSRVCYNYHPKKYYCCNPHGTRCCLRDLHKKPDCSSGRYGFFPDKCNCQKYYQCYNRTLNHFTCPRGGAWTNNSKKPACVQLYNPKKLCRFRPFKPEKIIPHFIKITFVIKDSTRTRTPTLRFSGTFLQQPLYNIMLNFAATRTDFSFRTSFHPVFWRFITCINGRCGVWNPDKTYWKILHNGVSIRVGASSFIPQPGSTITFNFVVFDGNYP